MIDVYDALSVAGIGNRTRATTAVFGTGVVGCTGRLDCAGTVANAVFHAELKGTGFVPGVTCDIFPCTLLDEE